jgi:hypothetical protein
MRELVVLALIATLLLPGCSAAPALSRSGWQTQPRMTADGQVTSIAARRASARRIPLGSKVKVKMLSGEVVKGTLRAVDDAGVLIEKPRESVDPWGHEVRTPASTIEVSYATMQSIDRTGLRWWGKALIIWAASAAVVTVIMVATGFGSD